MKQQAISLGRIFGIPVDLDYSWFLIFILLTWTFATGYFPAEFKGWPVIEYWIVGMVTALLMFASVLLHEFGHSMVAIRYRIPVRKITLFIFGGVAQISAESPNAMAEFWIAIAGPVVSFLLAGLFGLLQYAVTGISPLLALLKYLAYINGTLGLFNLIPAFPLDGGRVFRAILWGSSKNLRRATLIAANTGRVIAFLFILFGVWQIFNGNLANGLWIAFIGWFLENAARGQVQQQQLASILADHTAIDAMSRDLASAATASPEQPLSGTHMNEIRSIPASMKLVEAVEVFEQENVDQLAVKENGQIIGVLSRESLLSFLRSLKDGDKKPPSTQHLSPNP